MPYDWSAVKTIMDKDKSRASSPVPASPAASAKRSSSGRSAILGNLDVDEPTTPLSPRPAFPPSLRSPSFGSRDNLRSSVIQSPASNATGIFDTSEPADSTTTRTPIPEYPDSLRPSSSESRQARLLPPPPRQSIARTPDPSTVTTPHSTPTRTPGRRMTSNERTQRYTPSKSSPLRVSEPSLEEKNEASHSSATTESWSRPSPRAETRSPAPSPHTDAGSPSHVVSRSAGQVQSPLLEHVTGTAAQRRPSAYGLDYRRHAAGHARDEPSVLSELSNIQDTGPSTTNSSRTEWSSPHLASFAKEQEDSINAATDARTRPSRATRVREPATSSAHGSQAAVQHSASDSLRSGAGLETPMYQHLHASSRGESKPSQIREAEHDTPSRKTDLQVHYKYPEGFSDEEEPEQTWSPTPRTGNAAAQTPKPRQDQPVPVTGNMVWGDQLHVQTSSLPLSTNEPHRTSNIKWPLHWFIRLFCFLLFVFLTLPYWIPYVERVAESQAVSEVDGFVNEVRNAYHPDFINSTAAKFDLHAQVCHIDSIRCNIVHHEPHMQRDFFDTMVLRYQSDHFDPPCPAVGCLGRPTPALPTAIEEVVGGLFANVSLELLQLDEQFDNLQRVFQDCGSRLEPLLVLLHAIVADWEREKSLLERCGRLLHMDRMEGEEQYQENEMVLSWTLHQATIQSCKFWMFAHKTAVTVGAAQESSLTRWKTIKWELEMTRRKCNNDVQNNWLAIATTTDWCKKVRSGLGRPELRRQLPDSAVEFLESKLTCSGAELATEWSRSGAKRFGEMVGHRRTLPELPPIAAPYHGYYPLNDGQWDGIRAWP